MFLLYTVQLVSMFCFKNFGNVGTPEKGHKLINSITIWIKHKKCMMCLA